MTRRANDTQVAGNHYKQHGATGEQHWDRVARIKLDYMQAQITKYVERCWDKHGLVDLEKAGHFIQKYIEQNAGRKGALQLAEDNMRAALADATQRIADMEALLNGIAEDANSTDPMRHQSTARFCFEGIKENKVHYRCRRCREHLFLTINQQPQHLHTCGPLQAGEPSTAYVDQG